MAKKKFDYNGDEFYMEIMALAMQGLTDSQIAFSLSEKFGQSLDESVFSRMKNGKYDKWSKEENVERSNRIGQALTHGREKVNSIVRGSYLKSALGGKKVKTITRRFLEIDCECKGKNKKCKKCGGVGKVPVSDKAIVQENEQELPPNMQALATWLFNHDKEWRKSVIEGKKLDVTSNGKDIQQVTIFELPDNGRDVENKQD